jgi:hypothetical protein
MEPSTRKLVEQVGFSQPVRVDNGTQDMHNAKFKMHTLSPSPQLDEGRGVVHVGGR